MPGPDGDVVLGSDKAPVTIIEYASMTCPHCAHFSATTFPELQQRYIDTGKVRYILREFPLDPLAAAGFMLARCAGKDKYMAVVETLFAKQADWIVKEPLAPLKEIAKQFGFTEESFNQCLTNQKVLDSIQAVRDRAAEKLGINSVPTFFVNGKKLVGDMSIEALAKEIRPLSQGRIRVFCPWRARQAAASGLPGPRAEKGKVWKTQRRCCARGRDDSFSAPMRHCFDTPKGVSPR